MANDSKIVITAGLQIPETVSTVEKELKVVGEKISADRALKIVANLDLPKTTQRIQSQLATLTKDLKLDISGVNVNSTVMQTISAVQNSISKVGTNINIQPKIDSKAVENVSDTLKNFGIGANNVERLTNLKAQLADIQKLVAEFDNTQPVEKQRESIIRIDNALKIVKADIDAISKAASQTSTNVDRIYPNLSFNKSDSSTAILTDAKNQLNTFFNAESIDSTASRVKRAVEDASGSLQRFYVQVERGDGAVETLTYALNQQANAYEYLGKITREADNSTDFRHVDISTQIELQTQKLEKFATDVGKSSKASGVLREDIANLRNELSRVGDTNAMKAFLDNFDIAKAKFQSLNSETKVVEASIKKLNQLLNNTQFRNNANNPAVSQQRADIEALRTEYEGLLRELSNANNPQSLQNINTQLAELKPRFDAVVQSSNELSNSLKNNSSATKLESDIRNLTNRVETFASTNKRATESLKLMRNGVTFADEWKRITEQLKSGNLDDNAIRRLSNDLRNFQAEARNANLTTSKFFTDMGSQLKMLVTRWLSLYTVIGRVTSALNDLKEVDKILTEIAKSSDVTRESLEELGNAAFKTANQYGRTAADYLYGVQEFSRAGFRGDQLTGLTEVSLLAQSAGDIETDLANSYIIATNAAYGYKGSVEELTEVLDRQNYVTNNYALNMTDLANAIKIAASQAAQSGVEIDEMTAALATMISSTQQSGEEVSRALRGILMNIQQVKGEVGDGEEDITTESLNKYEKAAANLGVALKEVKDGVVVLRDPMQVLNDLAVAFNKESDDSIKKAELINAVGGKYRGNQLAALLGNWDTYKDILNTFNSEQAVGSAFRETQKDVESWSGQLNILKNNWDEFINAVINSNTAINTLKGFSSVLNGLVSVSDKLGGLGTVATLISGVAGAKGRGILSAIQQYSRMSKNIAGITVEDVAMLRNYNALLAQGVPATIAQREALNGASVAARNLATSANDAAVSEEVLAQAEKKVTLGARASAVAVKALGVALNVAFNMAVVAIISAIVKGLDELIVTQKEEAQLAEEQRQKALDAMSAYEAESTALNDVVSQYTKMISSTSDLSSQKEQLLNLQNQLPDSYKEEADGIDLVNGKISDNIALLNELERKKADQYVRDNQGAYETAVQKLDVGYTYVGGDLPKKFRDQLQDLAAQNNIEGYNSITGQFEGTAQERLELYRQLRDMYAETDEHNSKWLAMLDEQIQKTQKLVDEIQSVVDGYEKARKIASLTAQEYNLINQATLAYREYQTSLNSENKDEAQNALSALHDIKDEVYSMTDSSSALRTQFDELWNTFTIGAKESVSSIEEVRADFAELSGEAFDNELKNIESISKAIDSMLNDETLSHEDAWKLLNLDTEGVLSDIQLINGQYKLSSDQLVALMEQQINKQKESIETTKAAAQAEYDLLQAQLRRLKVNSPSDVAAYKLEVERITEEMRDMQDVIFGSDLLLQELNGILGKTYSITGSIATGLSNAVKQFEAEVEAIDDTIDSLNNRKDVLESEKKELQEQLDVLNEQKKVIEEQQKLFQKAVTDYMKRHGDSLKSQLDSLKQQQDDIKDEYEERIKVLKDENEERDLAYKKEKALLDLNKAKQQQVRTYSSARGWEYGASKEKVVEAQKNLDDVLNEEQIKALEKERDEKIKLLEKQEKALDHQIKAYEEYVKQYDILTEEIEDKDGELLAEQLLGSDWREKIEKKDEGLLRAYKREYSNFSNELERLTKIEIENIEASIKAKENEIDKIGDEITAYNNYKTAVQSNLNDAKSALENYKNSMDSAKNDVISAASDMEHGVWENLSKIQQWMNNTENNIFNNKNKAVQWFTELADACESMQNRLANSSTGYGIVNSAWDARLVRGYADGGVANYTGLALLHGTRNKAETIFNANDSKKLYEAVHETPSVMASIIKQAVQLSGFNPSNVINNNGANTSSINVRIGQIVANNPQELTRNLDKTLDSYFRQKLTQSYVQ